jgi:hypothetical protein
MFVSLRSGRAPTVSSDDLRRSRVDPEHRLPAEGLRTVEALALRVLERLPFGEVGRTRDVIQIDDGGEEGVCIVIAAEHLSDEVLDELLAAARRARGAQFRRCRFCGERFPPERRHGDVCHGCAEKHLGVIH